MKYEDFLELIETNKKLTEMYSELHDIGIDFFEGKYKLVILTENLFNITLGSHYNEDGVEWVNWFMYENEFGDPYEDGNPRLSAIDSDGSPICYSVKSLWEYLEKHHKISG